MKQENIDILLQKYMAAETTSEEDAVLKTEILTGNSYEDYANIRVMFGYFELQKTETKIPEFTNPAQALPRRKAKIYSMPWIAAAASVAVIVLSWFIFGSNFSTDAKDTFNDPAVAAQSASEALQLLSGELNKGKTLAMEQMKEFDNLNKYLNIF